MPYVTGRDLSHHNVIRDYAAASGDTDWVQVKVTEGTTFIDPAASTHHAGFFGRPRGPYHFAQRVDVPGQVAHFLATKDAVGQWERNDMLDCEFPGVNAAFIGDLVAEHRRQSGAARRYVYVGLNDLMGPCDPALWIAPDVDLWVPRYRKTGRPVDPVTDQPSAAVWGSYLGFWHPAIRVLQWDDAWPLTGADGTDVNDENVAGGAVPPTQEDDDMQLTLTPHTATESAARGCIVLPGKAADPGTRVYVTTGWGNKITMRLWFVGAGGVYLGSHGGDGAPVTVLSDRPDWLPVPAGTLAIHAQWNTLLEVAGDLRVRFTGLPE